MDRLAPYEKRVIELIRNGSDKRARKLAKKRVRSPGKWIQRRILTTTSSVLSAVLRERLTSSSASSLSRGGLLTKCQFLCSLNSRCRCRKGCFGFGVNSGIIKIGSLLGFVGCSMCCCDDGGKAGGVEDGLGLISAFLHQISASAIDIISTFSIASDSWRM